MKTMENKSRYPFGLCEWCGKPLVEPLFMRVNDDNICMHCFKGYRRDKERVRLLQKEAKNG